MWQQPWQTFLSDITDYVLFNNVNKQKPITITYQYDMGNEIVDKIFQKKRKGRPKRILQKEFPQDMDKNKNWFLNYCGTICHNFHKI